MLYQIADCTIYRYYIQVLQTNNFIRPTKTNQIARMFLSQLIPQIYNQIARIYNQIARIYNPCLPKSCACFYHNR